MAAKPGDILIVVHGFDARSPDELSLRRNDLIELIESDSEFGDGWYLGRSLETNDSGLFPEVYTRLAPKPTINAALHQRSSSQATATQHDAQPPESSPSPLSAPLPLATPSNPAPLESSSTGPLQVPSPTTPVQPATANRTSLPLQTRSISQTLSGDAPHEEDAINSPVMHETLSVIDEHITDMSTPRHSVTGKDSRGNGNDSGSEYSSHHRLSYINGHETEEEEQNMHTEQEVMTWSSSRVAEYLEDAGVEQKHCNVFKEQEINGEALLGMDQATIFLKEFELGPVGPRLRTWLKIKALQEEVKTLKEAQKNTGLYDNQDEPATLDPVRNRATSMSAVLPRIPSLSQNQASRPGQGRQPMPRANSSAGNSPNALMEATSPLAQFHPSSPTRPSAASVRSLNHNRRHSSIDSTMNMPPPTSAGAMRLPPIAPSASSHKKSPSFDRGWTMNSPQEMQTPIRPSSSQHNHSATDPDAFGRNGPLSVPNDFDRGYFSGGEVDNRKARNVLRKKDSPSHSRAPSFNSDAGRRSGYGRRHSRIGSADSIAVGGSPISPAAKAYYGSSIKSGHSSSNYEYGRPLKSATDVPPTVTKLDYDSPSIDAIANSPRVPHSEASSTGRASPSPAANTHSHSFFSKKSRSAGLRAISDAITGSERANAKAAEASAKDSPTRTGSTTPSGASASKSFDSENPELNKRNTAGSTSTNNTSTKKKSKKHGTSAYTRGRQPIPPQEALKGCDYSGWMKKKSSSVLTTWKTRLFVLRGRRLSYYYTEFDSEEKGLIDISSHRVLPANDETITGLHAALTRAGSSPSSPLNATIPTAAGTDSANGESVQDVTKMFIFKLVPPRAGLQRGVQFTKPIVHYFAVDSIQIGRLWMAALMKATIDRDDSLSITTTYQQKTITLEKARQMRQRPPALMDENDDASVEHSSKKSEHSKESIQENVIHEEDERQGLAISGLDDAKALLDYAESSGEPLKETTTIETTGTTEHKRKESFTPGLVSFGG